MQGYHSRIIGQILGPILTFFAECFGFEADILPKQFFSLRHLKTFN